MNAWATPRRWRRLALFAALLACCLRALNPPGAMLAFTDGMPGWVPCVAEAAHQPAAHDHAGHHHAGSDHAAHEHAGHAATVCPFAVAHAAGVQAPHVATLVPVWLPLQGGAPAVSGQWPRLPPLRFHAPRGPPLPA